MKNSDAVGRGTTDRGVSDREISDRRISDRGLSNGEEAPVIRKLKKEECLVLRPLWEEVFYEDSKEFTDYYFQEKAQRNHAFVISRNTENGKADDAAMLYLSPYEMMLRAGAGFECREINYIVGVATKAEYRHRGYMDRLLKAALCHMQEQKQPFAFLMPANPAIYTPYQFTYIYDREEPELRAAAGRSVQMEEKDIPALAGFASSYLRKKKDVFIRRDEEYYSVMKKELAVQNGGIRIFKEKDEICGYFLYTRENGREEIQEAVMKDENAFRAAFRIKGKTPIIMARIVDVPSMLSLLRTEAGSVMLTVRIKDSIIEENNAVWEWKVSPEWAQADRVKNAQRAAKTGETADCRITIDALTAWIFGYKKAEECFVFQEDNSTKAGKMKRQEVLGKLTKIRCFQNIFINEIV